MRTILFFVPLIIALVSCTQKPATASADDAVTSKLAPEEVAQSLTLPEAVQKSLGDSPHLRRVLATTNLPPTIVALCADGSG